MNRFIIVGNGFDLSHGLSTKYQDVLFHFFKNEIIKSIKTKEMLSNRLISCNFYHGFSFDVEVYLNQCSGLDGLVNEDKLVFKRLHDNITNENHIKITSVFIDRIFSDFIDKRWVDVEKTYFDLLLEFATKNEKNVAESIKSLNSDFQFFKNITIDYLNEVSKKFNELKISDHFKFQVIDSIFGGYRPVINPSRKPNELHIINFNYTSFVFEYSNNPSFKSKIFHHNIHGGLNNPDRIVFGYGNFNDQTKLLEKMKDDESLRFLKQYLSLLEDNVKRIISKIQEDPFEVIVLGHSCGESDGYLLRSVFGSENCKSIIIYNRSEKELRLKTNSIREFLDYENNKVFELISGRSFPQLTK